ncbi:MAG: hypothetical protein ABIR70_17680 [Bryobacteraceae bacterium]
MNFLLTLLLLAAPYWEVKSAADWSDVEISQLLADSPWAQKMVTSDNKGNFPPAQVYIASARPIQLAEQERTRRGKGKSDVIEESALWMEDNAGTHIILAIRVTNITPYSESKELAALKSSAMRIGRLKLAPTSYFPPSARDPYLRIAFPRQVQLSDKKVQFDLYIPGLAGPFRLAEFPLDPMVVAGKLEL